MGTPAALDLTAAVPVDRLVIDDDGAYISFQGRLGHVSVAPARGLPLDPRSPDTVRGTHVPFETTAEILAKKLRVQNPLKQFPSEAPPRPRLRLIPQAVGQELGWSAATGSDERWGWYGEWIRDMAAFFGRDWRGDRTGRITGAPEECSWVGRERDGNSGPCLGVRQVYGVPSMVLRYAMDRWGEDYPGGERALVRRFTQSPARGFASLVDVSPDKSWGPEAIFTGFYITLWLDLQGWTTYGMTTWDLQDIFDRLPENWQLKPYTSSSHTPRLTGRRVRAGSTSRPA